MTGDGDTVSASVIHLPAARSCRRATVRQAACSGGEGLPAELGRYIRGVNG